MSRFPETPCTTETSEVGVCGNCPHVTCAEAVNSKKYAYVENLERNDISLNEYRLPLIV